MKKNSVTFLPVEFAVPWETAPPKEEVMVLDHNFIKLMEKIGGYCLSQSNASQSHDRKNNITLNKNTF